MTLPIPSVHNVTDECALLLFSMIIYCHHIEFAAHACCMRRLFSQLINKVKLSNKSRNLS